MQGCGRKVGVHDCCTIIQADCISVLKELPEGFFHLVLTDPPYGVGLEYDDYKDSVHNLRQLVSGFMPECLRLSPLTMITPGIKNICLYPQPDWILAWIIRNGEFRSPWGFSCWQPILCYGENPHLANGLGSRPDIIEMPTNISIKSIHPCPKPTKIWRNLLLRAFPVVTPNSVRRVLDPFSGTGTTARVARDHGIHFLCIEKSRKYWEESVYLFDNSPDNLFED